MERQWTSEQTVEKTSFRGAMNAALETWGRLPEKGVVTTAQYGYHNT